MRFYPSRARVPLTENVSGPREWGSRIQASCFAHPPISAKHQPRELPHVRYNAAQDPLQMDSSAKLLVSSVLLVIPWFEV
jgi:hypothetical protein